MRGGKLVNLSVDVYIAMELADGGDLFHLRGQMSSEWVGGWGKGGERVCRHSLGLRWPAGMAECGARYSQTDGRAASSGPAPEPGGGAPASRTHGIS